MYAGAPVWGSRAQAARPVVIGRHTIDSLLDEIVTLPSLPASVGFITQAINDPTSSLADVARAVETDPSISLKSLRLINSAYYGLPHKVNSVDHAVSLLGIKVIRNLVYTATAVDTFQRGSEELFRHSATCALLMRSFAQTPASGLGIDPDEAFVYGLLHDVGKIILIAYLPDEMQNAERLSRTDRLPMFEAERRIIGVDHAELGGRLAQKWGLSEELVAALAGHHDLNLCRQQAQRKVAAILSISDFICNSCGIVSTPSAYYDIADDMWDAAELTSRKLPPVIDRFFGSWALIDDFLAMAS